MIIACVRCFEYPSTHPLSSFRVQSSWTVTIPLLYSRPMYVIHPTIMTRNENLGGWGGGEGKHWAFYMATSRKIIGFNCWKYCSYKTKYQPK